jgi:hypothetical protein
MELRILETTNQKIAEVISTGVVINDVRDALDLMVNAGYEDIGHIILYERHLNRDFFDLRTGLAGDILQKCVNYHMKLAIVGDFEKFGSNSLNALIVESNRGKQVFFVPDVETAIVKLGG